MEGPLNLKAALTGCVSDPTRTLLNKLHVLRRTSAEANAMETKADGASFGLQGTTPRSSCPSSAASGSGIIFCERSPDSWSSSEETTQAPGLLMSSRQSSHERLSEEAGQSGKQAWLTDKEISASAQRGEERSLSRWVEAKPAGAVDGTLEELWKKPGKKAKHRLGAWDQFKANEELFGYVSTFKEDLSQYSTAIDISKVPDHARQRADRLAREIELRQCGRGDVDGIVSRHEDDEEKLFSSVSRALPAKSGPAAVNHGSSCGNHWQGKAGVPTRASEQQKHDFQQVRADEELKPSTHQERPEDLSQQGTKVAGSFFHVDGVGLMDERHVRHNQWIFNQAGPAVPLQGHQPYASTLSTGPAPAPASAFDTQAASRNAMLSTRPVAPSSALNATHTNAEVMFAPGTRVMVHGLTKSPGFNGLSGVVESFDALCGRYDVLLTLQDGSGLNQLAKLKAENLSVGAVQLPQCQ
eukprot:TRINITY_DN21775_c0_g1_i1.p1 TRINITY_DN21775_c0_g1~~TRINITY_DN21775_c0_g1_i1.p1  ORF type:complete len:469 (+),score=94.51 TRINITY_DN21775_c0_g1_i1:96-1502(+)